MTDTANAFNFLAASERSGGNLLVKLLGSHSKICGPAPKHLIHPLANNYHKFSLQKHWLEANGLLSSLRNSEFSRWAKDKSCLSLGDGKVSPIEFVKALLMEEMDVNKKASLFIKENRMYEYFAFILAHFPKSKFVHLVRDPRDMALSWKRNLAFEGEVCCAAMRWQKEQLEWLKFASSFPEKIVSIKYEDLITEPEKELSRVLSFLGFSWEEQVLDTFYLDPIVKLNSTKQSSWSNLSKPLIKDNKGKYLRCLSETEISMVESICRVEMELLGYPIVGEVFDISNVAELLIIEKNKKPALKATTVQYTDMIKKKFYQF